LEAVLEQSVATPVSPALTLTGVELLAMIQAACAEEKEKKRKKKTKEKNEKC